ncbi:hypothetical protein ACFLSE_02750 [Bacteroidota bacterium]
MRKFLLLFIPSSIIIFIIWMIPFSREVSEGITEEAVPIMAAPPQQSWQEIITWIIGTLNGLFGMILLVKKVFTKSK